MIDRPNKLKAIQVGFYRASIVSITGLRQSGKTTIAKEFASKFSGKSTHFDLEEPRSLALFNRAYDSIGRIIGIGGN